MKGDKSKKVGGRRKAGPAATKSSMGKTPQGKRVTSPAGKAFTASRRGKLTGPNGQP
jgi:hypothetical protein